jgi:hypothetical protein
MSRQTEQRQAEAQAIDHDVAGIVGHRPRRGAWTAVATAVLVAAVGVSIWAVTRSDSAVPPVGDHDDSAGLSCPADDYYTLDLDVPGPGKPDPVSAVRPLEPEADLRVADSPTDENSASVHVVDDVGHVDRVYTVQRLRDGWWPSGLASCRELASMVVPQ